MEQTGLKKAPLELLHAVFVYSSLLSYHDRRVWKTYEIRSAACSVRVKTFQRRIWFTSLKVASGSHSVMASRCSRVFSFLSRSRIFFRKNHLAPINLFSRRWQC